MSTGTNFILRDDAIAAVMNTEAVFDTETSEPYQKTRDVTKALHNLPTIEVSEDCISRAEALDEFKKDYDDIFDLMTAIEELPSVVPTTEMAIDSESMEEIQTQVIEFPDTHQKFVFTRKIGMDGDCVKICDWEYKGVKNERKDNE